MNGDIWETVTTMVEKYKQQQGILVNTSVFVQHSTAAVHQVDQLNRIRSSHVKHLA